MSVAQNRPLQVLIATKAQSHSVEATPPHPGWKWKSHQEWNQEFQKVLSTQPEFNKRRQRRGNI